MTTTRALRGPFDYRLPEELRGGVVDVGSMLVVPFGRRQVLGRRRRARRPQRGRRGAAAGSAASRWSSGVPADLVGLAEWVAAEYCSTTPRALGWSCRPTRPGASAGASAAPPRVHATAPWALAARTRRCSHAEQEASARGAGRRARRQWRRRAAAARRDGLGQDRDLPARGRRRARAGARRDRARARDRAHAADRGPLRRTLRRDGRGAALAPEALRSATPSGGGCAKARRACASVRARRSSRRSRIWG